MHGETTSINALEREKYQMRIDLEVVLPPGARDTVELIHALTWAKFRHSAGLKTALEETRVELGLSENQLRAALQSSWRKISSLAREGKLEVWGKPIYDRHFDAASGWRGDSERQLSPDELRNCRFVSWPFDPKAKQPMPRVERYRDTFSGSFVRHTEQTADEFDFVRVTVNRTGLLNEFKVPRPQEIRDRASSAKIRKAVNEAIADLGEVSPEVLHSFSRQLIMPGLIHKHGLSFRPGGEADAVWKQLTTSFPMLSRPGPRPNPPTQ